MIGKTISHYRILEKLGAGGMGEVYRAEDTNLSRQVAIKVLPEFFAKDPERLARFAREAKLLASLNHPNIAAIHGLEEAEGKRFLILELVEGQTLAERLHKGPLPVDDTLDICRQVAEGLEAAHEKGIIHRDLKPANIKITPEGKVKILDFGLAKAFHEEPVAADLSQSPTVTEQMSRPGVILGTAAYMSPEQAKGKPLDKRTDIWAFGCVLFECLTSRRAFEGETVSETLAAILKGEPEWKLLPADTPWKVKDLLHQCLRKDLARRFQHMGDLRIALLDIKEELDSGVLILGEPVKASPRGERWRLGWAAAAGFMLIILGLIIGQFIRLRPEQQEQPKFQRLTFRTGLIQSARFSPDGNTVFYGAAWEGDPAQVFSIRPDIPEFHPILVADAIPLSVSPSGELALLLKPRRAGWEMVGTLARIPLSGGMPRPELENVQWADLGLKGKMLIVRDGEKGNQLESPPGKVLFRTVGLITHARFSPAADRIAFLHHPLRDADSGEVMVVDLAGRSKSLSANWGSAGGLAWNPKTGEIWFTATMNGSKRELQAVTLTSARRTVNSQTGNLIVEDIARDGRVLLNTTSNQVKLQFVGPGEKNERDLSWLDVSIVGDISRNGQGVAFCESGEGAGQFFKSYYRTTDGSPPVMLGNGAYPRLSPDGKSVVAINQVAGELGFLTNGLVLLPIGPGDTRHIPLPGFRLDFVAWLPNGRGVLFTGNESGHGERVYSLDFDGGRPKAITPDGILPFYLLASPGSRFVAVVNLQNQVLLYPLAGGDPTICRGVDPGEVPWAWSPDEKSLFVMRRYVKPYRVYQVNWQTGERRLWKEMIFPESAGVLGLSWLVITPDGQSYAYSYWQQLSTLHIVDGLK